VGCSTPHDGMKEARRTHHAIETQLKASKVAMRKETKLVLIGMSSIWGSFQLVYYG